MALTKYIYQDIQPNIDEEIASHQDNDELIALFASWGFKLEVEGEPYWGISYVTDHGYAFNYTQQTGCQLIINGPHQFVEQIVFKDTTKEIKTTLDTSEGPAIIYGTLYLDEISYRMDATNCYLWSFYENGQHSSATQQNINLLKNLRFQIDTQQFNKNSHAVSLRTNPSAVVNFEYSRNSKFAFNNYFGDFINILDDSMLIKPNFKQKGQHNYNSQGTHSIEKGQFWGTESSKTIYEVLWDRWQTGSNSISLIYDSEDESYTIAGQTFYLPKDIELILVRKEKNFTVNRPTRMDYTGDSGFLGFTRYYWNKKVKPGYPTNGYGAPMAIIALQGGGDLTYKPEYFIQPSVELEDIGTYSYAFIPTQQNVSCNFSTLTWYSGLPIDISEHSVDWYFHQTVTIPEQANYAQIYGIGGVIELGRWDTWYMSTDVKIKAFDFLVRKNLTITAYNDVYYAIKYASFDNEVYISNIDWKIYFRFNYPINYQHKSLYATDTSSSSSIGIRSEIFTQHQYELFHNSDECPYYTWHDFPYSPNSSNTHLTPTYQLGMEEFTFDVSLEANNNNSNSVFLVAVRKPMSQR